jgi:predicted nucleic acid-binding protein
MNKIIIDATLLVALLDEKDIWHKVAVSIRDAMIESGAQLIFLDCVANETLTVLGRRCKRKNEEDKFSDLIKKFKKIVKFEELNWSYSYLKDDYEKILEKMERYKGQVSFHDVLISLFAQDKNICYIASFDSDFDKVEGLKRIKDREDFGGEI